MLFYLKFKEGELVLMIEEKIKRKQAKVGVIGLGYVGLPLLVEIAKSGFKAIGFDVDEKKVAELKRGKSYIIDISSRILKNLITQGDVIVTTDFSLLSRVDVVCICVPTPLSKTKEPDLNFVIDAADRIGQKLRKEHLIILESTTYPGTTREVVLPILEKSKLKAGKDFYLAFSPERVDPGNKRFTLKNTPRIVGGINPRSTKIASLFYSQFVEKVISVSSCEVAEMSKLLENIFRCVNIALVNELMLLCDRMGINIWEVIEAASTKPFGFMPFYPGPGLGGHCIPIDPFYLSWKAREYDFWTEFIELSGKTNENIPYFVVSKLSRILSSKQKSFCGSKILVLGVTYKRDIDDTRGSPALKIINLLLKEKAIVSFFDPYISNLEVNGQKLKSQNLTPELLKEMDCVLIVTDHSCIDYEKVVRYSSLILDTRNVLKNFNDEKIIPI